MKHIWTLLLVPVAIACTSTPKQPEPEYPSSAPPAMSQRLREPIVDYIGLQESLRMSKQVNDLGYIDKAFDTCQAGNGYSNTEDCHQEMFVLIQFQLLCRNSEGTVQQAVESEDIRPIGNRMIQWELAKKIGTAITDSEGYGQIRMSFPRRPNEQRLKLSTNQKYLYVQADEITRVVAPQNWCRSDR